jgi:CRISPR-associated protein Cmr6
MTLVLPESTLALLARVPIAQRHPGLQLDKYSAAGDQKTAQKTALDDVCTICGDAGEFAARHSAWRSPLAALPGAASFCGETTSPLTLHLARASALENAGICLHPLYGFVYLPGSGLKGMARAFAKTVASASADDIAAVFGNEPGEPKRDLQRAGNIVFHDAWPAQWPKLFVDIVNNHHPNYYQAKDSDNSNAPGDWEDPRPVYFLAVAPGTKFDFYLSKRRGDVPDELRDLAQQWLAGGLGELGAGAKTAAGYGAFKVAAALRDADPTVAQVDRASPPNGGRATFETTLELITPAFLAGASQDSADCDLRGATLRGQLRWWWRTMHSGFVDVATLRQMEAAIWGDTKHGSPLRIVVERWQTNQPPQAYDRKALMPEMRAEQKTGEYGIPNADREKANKTTQGLWYASYGMDERDKRRWYLSPGCEWTVRFAARRTERLTADALRDEAKSALWLLCYYGGVGSRGRKGFGSLAASVENWSLEKCRDTAREARRAFTSASAFVERLAASSSLEQSLPLLEIPFPWPDVWTVLDQAGFAYQSFAKRYAHHREKKALGLPRRIGRSANDVSGTFRPTGPIAALGNNARHSSPLHIHLARERGVYLVRILALPAAYLPDLRTSEKFLGEMLQVLRPDLERRAQLPPPAPRVARPQGGPSSGPTSRVAPATTGTVKANFLGPHEKMAKYFWVQEPGKAKGLLKYGEARDPLPQINTPIDVYRTNTNDRSPEYSWDDPKKQQASQPRRPPKGGGHGRR